MGIGKIFKNIINHGNTAKADARSTEQQYKNLQKQNSDLLEQSMSSLSSEAIANCARGSIDAMKALADLAKQIPQPDGQQKSDDK